MEHNELVQIVTEEYKRKGFEQDNSLKVDNIEPNKWKIWYFTPYVDHTFTIDLNQKISYEGFIAIWKKKEGYGRKLVETREEICKKLGVDIIVINLNGNNSFWKHMGYKRLGFLKRRFLAEKLGGIYFSQNYSTPRYKLLI